MNQQTYEDYWKLTLAFTDYNGDKFIKTLSICIDFIDNNVATPYSSEKYNELQMALQKPLNIDLISIRKAINQLVKLGFINSFLVSYPKESKEYVLAKTDRKRKTLLSKIVYSFSSFNRAVNEASNLHQMNFLVNTLVEVGKLNQDDIIALMLVDIEAVGKGYLNRQELDSYVKTAQSTNFISRKYNQISYLTNLLNKLDDIKFVHNELYFTEDAIRIFGEGLEETVKKRNPYLHLIYKNQLKEESFAIYNAEKCMVEKLAYPVLIASHIKPFIKSDDSEAYDANNGILLSRNLDALFDLGYITFEDDGKIKIANTPKIDNELKKHIQSYSLDNRFINPQRLAYLDYHRKEVFEKRYA